MGIGVPAHKNQYTDDPVLDRIQGNVRDLIAYVRSIGWVTRRSYAALAAVKVAGATYADLVTATITTLQRNGYLLIQFTASGIQNTSAATLFFKVRLNGSDVRGLYTTTSAGFSFNTAMLVRIPVTAGLQTVTVQWKTNQATATIDPPTTVEEHAALHIQEEAA